MIRIILFSLLAWFAAVLPANAGLLDPVLQRGSFPVCDDEKVLGRIVKRFNKAEEKTWNRGVYMADLQHIQPRAVLDGEDRAVARRYCRALTHLSNGRQRKVFYLIESGGGFAGNSFNLEFCVEGLDPWRIYDGSCRALRH